MAPMWQVDSRLAHRTYSAKFVPAMASVAALIEAAASDTRYSAAKATSSGLAFSPAARQFARTPNVATSAASRWVNPTTVLSRAASVTMAPDLAASIDG